MPVVQFQPFSSLVNPSFWHSLTDLKVDVLRLSDEPLTISASYTTGRIVKDRETGQDVDLGCNLSLWGDAFGKDAECVFLFGVLSRLFTVVSGRQARFQSVRRAFSRISIR